MAKRFVLLVAVAAPALAVGSVAFAALASHGATGAGAAYTGSAVSHDIQATRASDNLALAALEQPGPAPAELPAPADLAPQLQAGVDAGIGQPQAFKLALLADATPTSADGGTTNAVKQAEAKALAIALNMALDMVQDGATQDQVNIALDNAVSAYVMANGADPVVIAAALAVVQDNDNNAAVTAAVASVRSNNAVVKAALQSMTPSQQNATITIAAAVAPTVNTVAIALNTSAGTTSGGQVTSVSATTVNGPGAGSTSGGASGYTG
jgi:hypothetical protein